MIFNAAVRLEQGVNGAQAFREVRADFIKAFTTPEFYSIDSMVEAVQNSLKGSGLVETGDTIVIVAGNPKHSAGKTNSVRVAVIP